MPHSNFKQRSHENSTGFAKCSCRQTFDYSSPRDMQLKRRLHRKFCTNPPPGDQKISLPKKSTTFMDYQAGTSDRRRDVYRN